MTLDKNTIQSMISNHLEESARPLIVLLGVTACGKTALSVELCKALGNAEVVNADSRQLFKHLNIGTGKITPDQMQGVPHHLFDVLEPTDEVTAAWYKKEAERTIDDILDRGNIPMLVGGSMLYIAAITDGLTFKEQEDALRSPESNCKYDLLIFGLQKSRDDTVVLINNRIDAMFADGWMQEVQGLLDSGYTKEDPAMKSVGYKEIMEYIESGTPETLEDLRELISAKTRQYAKRQRTWWRNDTRIHWL